MTGPMIRDTVEVAKAIKKWNPDFPVILGGWHPSLLPTQTLEADYVDIIVRAQGEESMLEVAERLRDDAPLDDVLGIGFKRDGKLHFTPERPLKTPRQKCRPRRITWPTLTPTSTSAAAAGPCMFPASPALSIASYCTNAGVYGRKVECAAGRAGGGGDDRPDAALPPRTAVDGG